MSEKSWKVGDLARAAGVSVRTLHYYEAVGLLAPPARTSARHRLYGEADLRRLYRVLALRTLGLGLAEIAACLDRDDGALAPVVRRHIDKVDRQLEAQTRLRIRLQVILGMLERDEQPLAEAFLEAMEMMTMFERYYTPDQLARLEERRQALGDAAIRQGEQQWSDLIKEVGEAWEAGLDPASPPVQDLARRWRNLIEQFTGGDPGIRQGLQRMYESEGAQNASRGMVSPELMQYMQGALSSGEASA